MSGIDPSKRHDVLHLKMLAPLCMVSPAFPERGAGTYEIRKGSMILYFSNGFTQAIACLLDEAHPGAVRTVVLNGFPFESVR